VWRRQLAICFPERSRFMVHEFVTDNRFPARRITDLCRSCLYASAYHAKGRSDWVDAGLPTEGFHVHSTKMKNLFRALFSLGVLAVYFHFERKHPLRKETEPKLRRVTRNLTMAGLSAITIQTLETPIVSPLTRWVGDKRVGLLKLRALPRWLEVALAVVLMDYTLFLWHIFVHKNWLLWRFHAVHHADLDLDASTALRFHFGEMALSVPYRALQLVLLGIDEESFQLWQKFLALSILFHHSNVRLPFTLERFLSRLVATPRMHGIHHSQDFTQQWTNWSSGLSLWDYLHGTYRFNVPQSSITIGLPGVPEPADVTLPRIVEMPFVPDSAPLPQAPAA
jgi:sterol desaturase/sphingolipid hydroxylase (fatty acid hydroxylase superfamily)